MNSETLKSRCFTGSLLRQPEKENLTMDLDLTMDEDLKQEWLKALRSGEYKQAEGQLRADESQTDHGDQGFCCLGVLLDISKKGEWVHHEYDLDWSAPPVPTYEMDLRLYHYSMSETLPDPVLLEFGIPEHAAELLMGLNDGCPEYPKHSFDGIANVIEQGYYYRDDDDK